MEGGIAEEKGCMEGQEEGRGGGTLTLLGAVQSARRPRNQAVTHRLDESARCPLDEKNANFIK